MSDRISIVMPCYNCEKYISKSIDSLLNQSILPDEIILIDDKSSDNTLKILSAYQNKYKYIKVFCSNENKGASYSRNKGFELSRNEYILFMDSDDLFDGNLIQKYIDKIAIAKGKWSLLYSAFKYIDEFDNEIHGISRGMESSEEDALGNCFIRNSIISTSGVMVKRSECLKIGGFDTKLTYSEDWDLWLRLASKGMLLYIDEPLITIRRHKNNISTNVNNMLNGELTVLKKYDLDYIERAINRRTGERNKNIVDYVSVLFKVNYWDEAFKRLNLIEEDKRTSEVFFLLGVYYMNAKNIKLALESFMSSLKMDNMNAASANNIGAIYLMMNEVKNAKTYLNKALRINCNYMDAKNNVNLINSGRINIENIKFTSRMLRKTLITYSK